MNPPAVERVTSAPPMAQGVTPAPVSGFSADDAREIDAGLARAAAAGDTRAFASLVDRHHGACVRFAQRMLGSPEDAEEVVQDAFLRVWRALPRYDERQTFRGWLFTILANRCRSRSGPLRRLQRAFRPMEELPTEPAVVAAAAHVGVMDDVQAALAALPAEQREAFLLKHVDELDYDTMTTLTGASASALKMRVKRACAALRARLER